jgi:hypothetical protein
MAGASAPQFVERLQVAPAGLVITLLTLAGHPRLGELSHISDGSEPLDRPDQHPL